jgi:hypothetical protein
VLLALVSALAPWVARLPAGLDIRPGNASSKVTIALLCKASYAKEIHYWADRFVPQFYAQPYADYIAFWGDVPQNRSQFSGVPYHAIDIQKDRSRHGLLFKLRAAMTHFLYETSSAWFFRICGDTAVNFEILPLVIRELESEFDPLVDTMIQGACLGKLELTYIQGGSGFVFSRRAVFEFISDWKWVQESVQEFKNDDRLLSVYLNRVNLSFKQATNRFFIGHSFFRFKDSYRAVTNQSYNPCPQSPRSKKGCRSFFTRVKELAFWHDRGTFNGFIGRIDEIRALVRPDLYFYVPNNKPHLCVSSVELSGYYD